MQAADIGQGNCRVTNLLEKLAGDLEDGVSTDPLTEAVVLNCGHSYNESTVRALSIDPSKYLCPECRAPITDYKVSYTLRSLAERVATAPDLVEPQRFSPPQGETTNLKQREEAKAHFNHSRELFARGLQKESVSALFKALELDPNYEKAHDYLEFITDPKNQRRSSFTSIPLSPQPSAPPAENEEKSQSPDNSKPSPVSTIPLVVVYGRENGSLKGMIGPSPISDLARSKLEERNAKVRASYSKGTTSGYKLGDGTSKEVEAFVVVRELLLNEEIKKGIIQPDDLDDDSLKFRIVFSTQYAAYFNPRTGNEEYIELLDIKDPAVQKALEAYYTAVGAKKCQQDWDVIAYSKSTLNGKAPLNKSSDETLMSLPNNFEYIFQELLPQKLIELPTSTHRDAISRRLLFVQYFFSKLCQIVDVKLNVREQELSRPGNDKQKKALQIEISHLRSFQQQLRNFDIYALSKGLMIYPIGHIWSGDLDAISSKLIKQVEDDILNKQTRWDRVIAKKQLTDVQREYAKDVGGMLYLERWKYLSSGHRHRPKREAVVDVFMREALQFAHGAKYTAEGFKRSYLIHGFGEALKAEMKREFDDLAVLASNAIGHWQKGEYEIDDYPENATSQDKQRIDLERKKVLRTHIAAHRARVNHSLTLDHAGIR